MPGVGWPEVFCMEVLGLERSLRVRSGGAFWVAVAVGVGTLRCLGMLAPSMLASELWSIWVRLPCCIALTQQSEGCVCTK